MINQEAFAIYQNKNARVVRTPKDHDDDLDERLKIITNMENKPSVVLGAALQVIYHIVRLAILPISQSLVSTTYRLCDDEYYDSIVVRPSVPASSHQG